MDAKDFIISELAVAKAQLEVDILALRYENQQFYRELHPEEFEEKEVEVAEVDQ